MTVGFEFCYATKMYFTVTDYNGESHDTCAMALDLDRALAMAQEALENDGYEHVTCCDAYTGEIIFIARAHDDECVEEVDGNLFYYDNEWMDECGFDPYEGCYTFDC